MVEIRARGAVAVPIVVVEVVVAFFAGFVAEEDAGAAGGRGGGGGDVDLLDELGHYSVLKVGRRAGGGVAIVVGDLRVLSSVRGGGLGVVVCVAGTASPGTDTDVGFAVGERADEVLQGGVAFDGIHSSHLALVVEMDA